MHFFVGAHVILKIELCGPAHNICEQFPIALKRVH